MRTDPDPYYRTTLTLAQSGIRLELRAAHGLFSGAGVDLGSRLLLRTLIGDEHRELTRVLDVGCGYGPIGLGLKALVPERRVHLVDRDALAVEYASENARRSGFDDVTASASLGYDDVEDRDFDLIVSNIPAKAGSAAIEAMLLDADSHLAPGGLVAVVAITRLEESVAGVLDREPSVKVVDRRERRGHTVFHYRFTAPRSTPTTSGFDRGVYERSRSDFSAAGLRWPARTAYGLPEFDTLHYATRLMVTALARGRAERGTPGGRVLVVEPGQGHVPIAAWQARRPSELHLVSRDLLALRYSGSNLAANGCPATAITSHHSTGPGEVANDVDLAIVTMLESQPQPVTDAVLGAAVDTLRVGGRMLVAAGSTPISRWLQSAGATGETVSVVARERERGFSAVEVVRAGA